jgi:hypothetical protein
MNTQAGREERIEQNVRHTVAQAALRRIRRIVDEDRSDEAARAGLLHLLLRYGWVILLVAAGLLVYFLGVV